MICLKTAPLFVGFTDDERHRRKVGPFRGPYCPGEEAACFDVWTMGSWNREIRTHAPHQLIESSWSSPLLLEAYDADHRCTVIDLPKQQRDRWECPTLMQMLKSKCRKVVSLSSNHWPSVRAKRQKAQCCILSRSRKSVEIPPHQLEMYAPFKHEWSFSIGKNDLKSMTK